MAKVMVIFADGLEEVEALTQVDLLRRAGDEVTTVSIMDQLEVTSGDGITIRADAMFDDVDFTGSDLIVLPGGLGGTEQIEQHTGLKKVLLNQYQSGRQVAAICAAPRYFGALGFVRGRRAVVYPGLEETLTGAEVQQAPAVTDGNVTTGHGPGAAADFGFELVRVLHGEEAVKALKEEYVYPY
ncbi:MAG: DJ-1 family glyoxalase III [Anaerovoracaceae bacterium]|jgi:4-methyl-5(b-hydroxyethyl)-thiazole monophosphate biosynthesis